jgi:hypothetical protein
MQIRARSTEPYATCLVMILLTAIVDLSASTYPLFSSSLNLKASFNFWGFQSIPVEDKTATPTMFLQMP